MEPEPTGRAVCPIPFLRCSPYRARQELSSSPTPFDTMDHRPTALVTLSELAVHPGRPISLTSFSSKHIQSHRVQGIELS